MSRCDDPQCECCNFHLCDQPENIGEMAICSTCGKKWLCVEPTEENFDRSHVSNSNRFQIKKMFVCVKD